MLHFQRLLAGADHLQQAGGRIGHAVGIVVGERLLVRPIDARAHQLADIAAAVMAQLLLEDLVPAPPHQVEHILGVQVAEQRLDILKRFLRQAVGIRRQRAVDLLHEIILIDHAILAHDIGPQPLGQDIQHPSDSFLVT